MNNTQILHKYKRIIINWIESSCKLYTNPANNIVQIKTDYLTWNDCFKTVNTVQLRRKPRQPFRLFPRLRLLTLASRRLPLVSVLLRRPRIIHMINVVVFLTGRKLRFLTEWFRVESIKRAENRHHRDLKTPPVENSMYFNFDCSSTWWFRAFWNVKFVGLQD